MNFSHLFRSGQLALAAVSESFTPSSGATSPQIRKSGLLCLGIGMACFVLGAALTFAATSFPGIAMLPILLAYAFMVVGAYRLVLGKTPEAKYPGEVSIKRVLFGITTIIVVVGGITGLMVLCAHFYTQLKLGS